MYTSIYCYIGAVKLGTYLSTHRSASHRTKLLLRASVDSTNKQRHILQTCACGVRTWSDHRWSIKASIILCVFSVDNFFVVSVASAANWRILCYSEQNFAQFRAYRISYARASCAHIHSNIQTHSAPCGSVCTQVCSRLNLLGQWSHFVVGCISNEPALSSNHRGCCWQKVALIITRYEEVTVVTKRSLLLTSSHLRQESTVRGKR